MALITCPDCGNKSVSDQAYSCTTCGFPIRAHLAKLKREEEARQAEAEALWQQRERERTFTLGALVVVVIAIVLLVGSCISYSNEHPILRDLAAQGSQQPGTEVFTAQGKLQLQYACQSSNEKATTVQFSLINMHVSGPAATVWKQMVKCTTSNQVGVTDTATIPVASGSYDVGVITSASDTSWNMMITQG